MQRQLVKVYIYLRPNSSLPVHQDLPELHPLAARPQGILHAFSAPDHAHSAQLLRKLHPCIRLPCRCCHGAIHEGQEAQSSLHHQADQTVAVEHKVVLRGVLVTDDGVPVQGEAKGREEGARKGGGAERALPHSNECTHMPRVWKLDGMTSKLV